MCVHEVPQSPSELYGAECESLGGGDVADCGGVNGASGRPVEVHTQPRGTGVEHDLVHGGE